MLNRETIQSYNSIRVKTDKSILCHAPFSSLNFEQNGNVTACCYNRTHVLGTYPTNHLDEIWNGAKADELRNSILKGDLSGGCSACGELLKAGNYGGTKAIYYDEYAQKNHASLREKISGLFRKKPYNLYPRVIELELSNSCNLECNMCNGYFSSSIRRNREKLAPIKEVYDNDFIDQLEAFLPHVSDMKFLGGEPFMIDIYYRIWERILKVNPSIRVHITTNGTLMNERIRQLISKLNCGIIVSIDSLNPEHYKVIRVNADLAKVLRNIDEMLNLIRGKKTFFSVAVCPMQINAFDLKELMDYVSLKQVYIHFNTVWTPEEISIHTWNADAIGELLTFYSDYRAPEKTSVDRMNKRKFDDFISTLQAWQKEKTRDDRFYSHVIKLNSARFLALLPESGETRKVSLLLLKYYFLNDKQSIDDFDSARSFFNNGDLMQEIHDSTSARESLLQMFRSMGTEVFLKAYFESMIHFTRASFEGKEHDELMKKLLATQSCSFELPARDQLVSDIISGGVAFQLNWLKHHDIETLIDGMRSRYS